MHIAIFSAYKTMKKIILRIAGVLVGILAIGNGIHHLAFPLFDTLLEKINALVFLLLGAVFVIYGIRGKEKKKTNQA